MESSTQTKIKKLFVQGQFLHAPIPMQCVLRKEQLSCKALYVNMYYTLCREA